MPGTSSCFFFLTHSQHPQTKETRKQKKGWLVGTWNVLEGNCQERKREGVQQRGNSFFCQSGLQYLAVSINDRLDLLVPSLRWFMSPSKRRFAIKSLIDFQLVNFVFELDPWFPTTNLPISHHHLSRLFLPINDRFEVCCRHLSGLFESGVYVGIFDTYDEGCLTSLFDDTVRPSILLLEFW